MLGDLPDLRSLKNTMGKLIICELKKPKTFQTTPEIRQFMIYYARSLVHLSKRTTDQASDVPSIILFS